MAPKHSASPVNPPTWLTKLVDEVQHLRQDFARHASATREIRSITLETQHLVLSRLRPNNSAAPMAVPTNNPWTQTRTVKSIRNISQMENKAASERIRNVAIKIPRPTRPNQSAVARICWYHRQFGQASTNCIEPCGFVAPANQPINQPIPQFLVRFPLERVQTAQSNHVVQPIQPSEPSQSQPERVPVPPTTPAKQIETASGVEDNSVQEITVAESSQAKESTPNWNSLQELYEQSFPEVSDSSSSDSDSESEESQPENQAKNV